MAKSWYSTLDSAGHWESELYVDPYYSALSVSTSLGEEPIPRYVLPEEGSVYKTLFLESWRLGYALGEISVNPMPLLGVAAKSYWHSGYEAAEVTDGFNVIEALTTGFPDPGALSFFIGSLASFTDSTKTEKTGAGYSGLLINVGNYNIRANELIEDYWLETEFKLKGSNISKKKELSWSFALGYKEHFNSDIIDELKLSIKRERTDRDYTGWSLFKNSELEYLVILNKDKTFRFWEHWDKTAIRYFLLYGKRFPLGSEGQYVLSIGLGVAREIESGYRGSLALDKDKEWTFLIRPNLLF